LGRPYDDHQRNWLVIGAVTAAALAGLVFTGSSTSLRRRFVPVGHLNVEFKARTAEPERVLALLEQLGAQAQGLDAQTDVYYRSARGRLKLRRGNIKNSLIHYEREDRAGAKRSKVHLADLPDDRALDHVLDAALERDVVVRKQRHRCSSCGAFTPSSPPASSTPSPPTRPTALTRSSSRSTPT